MIILEEYVYLVMNMILSDCVTGNVLTYDVEYFFFQDYIW